jgi:hypothetical protein
MIEPDFAHRGLVVSWARILVIVGSIAQLGHANGDGAQGVS